MSTYHFQGTQLSADEILVLGSVFLAGTEIRVTRDPEFH